MSFMWMESDHCVIWDPFIIITPGEGEGPGPQTPTPIRSIPTLKDTPIYPLQQPNSVLQGGYNPSASDTPSTVNVHISVRLKWFY